MKIKKLEDLQGIGAPGTHTTITIGGDPTVGHIIKRFNLVLTNEQWNDFIEKYGQLKNLDFGNTSVRQVRNLKCCLCDVQLPHEELLESLILYSHIYSSIRGGGYTDEDTVYQFRFLLCGTSERHGCIHKILDDLKVSY